MRGEYFMKNLKKLFAIMLTVSMLVSLIPFNVQAASSSKIKLSKNKMTLYVGDTKTLKLKGTNKTPKWTSSKKSVATVTSKGKVTAKKKGSAVIKAKLGKNIFSCKVTVKTKAISDPVPTTTPVPDDTPVNTPVPDNTPTTPSTPVSSIEDNYQKLADYIMKNGEYDSDYKYYEIIYHETEKNPSLYTMITYNLDGTFEFSNMYYVDETWVSYFTLYITPPEYDKVTGINTVFELTDVDNRIYAKGEIVLSSLTTDENHITYTDSNARTEAEYENICESGDAMLNAGLVYWDTMIRDAGLGLALKDLGFTSYQ